MPRLDRLQEIDETLSDLLGLLEEELGRARAQTARLAALDGPAAFEYARSRETFTIRLAAHEARLLEQVGEAAQALGMSSFEVSEIRRRFPEPGARLFLKLAALGRAAAALRGQDARNLHLAGRARACVTGWLRALTGPAAAYTRRGAAQALPAFSTAVRVA
jgi:hypothetical protein